MAKKSKLKSKPAKKKNDRVPDVAPVTVAHTSDGNEAPTTSDDPPPKITPQSKKITREQIDALFKFFKDKNWPENKNLPKNNNMPALDLLLTKLGIPRKKASYQLRNWKKKEYQHHGKVFSLKLEEVKELIEEHMTMPNDEFVSFVLDLMNEKKNDGSLYDSFGGTIYAYAEFVDDGLDVLDFVVSEPYFAVFFESIVAAYTDIAVEQFPKIASMLPGAELAFQVDRQSKQTTSWFEGFYSLVLQNAHAPTGASNHSTLQAFKIGDWRMAFSAIEMALYTCWTALSHDSQVPEIEIPKTPSVHPYSEEVLYHVAGWVISQLAKTKKQKSELSSERRYQQPRLAEMHSLTKAEAEEAKLPTDLVNDREKESLRRPSAEFYNFITHIETVFMANMSVDMMKGYSSGNLLNAVKVAILDSEMMKAKFSKLCQPDFDDDGVKAEVMLYILDKYKHMRGRWFQKGIKGQTNETYGCVNKAATRAGVAAKGLACKTSGKDEFGEMYKSAKKVIQSGAVEEDVDSREGEDSLSEGDRDHEGIHDDFELLTGTQHYEAENVELAEDEVLSGAGGDEVCMPTADDLSSSVAGESEEFNSDLDKMDLDDSDDDDIKDSTTVIDPSTTDIVSLRSALDNERKLVSASWCQSGDENEVIRRYKGRTITRGSVHRLRPGVWLNDELIQYFTVMVSNNDDLLSSADPSRKRSCIFSTFFYSHLMEGAYSYETVARWTRSADIFELVKILIPINVGGVHWIAVMVSMMEKSIQLYDRSPGPGGAKSQRPTVFCPNLAVPRGRTSQQKGGRAARCIKLASSFARPATSYAT
jgi:hypothetical protein